jgi:multiple antibiotic resistance protein
MIDTFLLAFIPLFVAFDVLGLLPLYIKYTMSMDDKQRSHLLRDSLLTAFIISLIFVVIGNRVLTYLGISMKDFLIAGGIVILTTALKDLIAGHGKPEDTELMGIVPLGVPLLAGPAVLATSIIIWKEYPIYYYIVSLVLNIVICWLVLHFSGLLLKVLGPRAIEALSKVMGLIVASIAIMFIRRGIQGF